MIWVLETDWRTCQSPDDSVRGRVGGVFNLCRAGWLAGCAINQILNKCTNDKRRRFYTTTSVLHACSSRLLLINAMVMLFVSTCVV